MVPRPDSLESFMFLFTKAAEEKNAKNVLLLKNKELAKVYIENWEKHKGHSEPY
jgi:hypothetical protein